MVTGTGSLSCRHIVHVVSPVNLQACQQAVRAAIKAAASKEITSLAFPPVGGGGGNLPLDQVVGTIVDTLANSANQNDIGGLTLIRLIGYKDFESYAFEIALKQAMHGKLNIAPANAVSLQSQTNCCCLSYNDIVSNYS